MNVSKNLKKKPTEPGFKPYVPRLAYVVSGLLILAVMVARIRLLGIPLERDEGEFAYMGQLILQGVPPYVEAYNMKLPGIYVAYALVMAVFGQSIAAVHIGLLLANASALVSLYLLGKRLMSITVGLVAAATHAVLSVMPSTQGTSAHATHFVIALALPGFVLLFSFLDNPQPRRLLVSGLLFGLAFLMKQPGGIFFAYAVLLLIWETFKSRPITWKRLVIQCAIFVAGFALPFGVICLWLWLAGAFPKFWFWTVDYARAYGSLVDVSEGLNLLSISLRSVTASALPLWILGLAGLILPLTSRATFRLWGFVFTFFVVSFAAVCPGFYFRPHYFVLLIPAVALLCGAVVCTLTNLLRARPFLASVAPIILFLTVASYSIWMRADFLYRKSLPDASRKMYFTNPFPESIHIARYIQRHTRPDDSIAVLGSEPQIPFYSRRRSATGYIYMYPLMESHRYARDMQKDLIRQLERAKPKMIVFVRNPMSWAAQPQSHSLLFSWSREYLDKHYQVVGVADILASREYFTEYIWGPEARNYEPASPHYVLIYKRISR